MMTPFLLACLCFFCFQELVSGRRLPHNFLQGNPSSSETISVTATRAQQHDPHAKRTYPDWKFEDGFEFYNFWTPNEEQMVRTAFVGAIDLMQTAMFVLSGTSGENLPFGENDPSFKRYFNPGELNTFGAVIQRLLAVLGAPGTSAIRQCVKATKLQLIYGDGPTDDKNKPFANLCSSNDGKTFAYYNSYFNENAVIRSYISFCPPFFQQYKLHMRNPAVPAAPFVNPGKFLPWIDNTDRFSLPEVESGPAIVMHEMLHWLDITNPVIEKQIVDVPLERPDDKTKPRAYRSFYSQKVKDPNWKAGVGPLQNADCYVYTVLEIFYRYRYGRQAWLDSPDPKGQPISPNIPPSGPQYPPQNRYDEILFG